MPFSASSAHGWGRGHGCATPAGPLAFGLPRRWPLLTLFGVALWLGSPARVQAAEATLAQKAAPAPKAAPANPNQPYAINKSGLLPPPCPLIVPPDLPALQPVRIDPSQVAAKNRMGCLSAADALYGPDGCPVKLCPASSGSLPLAPFR